MNWILACASLVALTLGLFLSLWDKRGTVRRVSTWVSVFVVTATAVGYWIDLNAQRLHFRLVGPQLSAQESYDIIREQESEHLQLLEAIGSYYTCVRKPDSIFLQFCEWVFVLREPDTGKLVEYRVLDSRMPELPILPNDILLGDMREGGFTTYTNYNLSPKALGIRHMDDQDSAIHHYDALGRVVVKIMGKAPRHLFDEIHASPNEFAISLTRTVNRPTDHLPESSVIERWNRFGDVQIQRATRPLTPFYENLRPITFSLDAQEAISAALAAGAEFEVPGKSMVSTGGVRLYDGGNIGVPGPCWRLPMRMAIRPIVVQAKSGRVYFVDDDGGYTAYWSIKHYLPELVIALLFLLLLAMALPTIGRRNPREPPAQEPGE